MSMIRLVVSGCNHANFIPGTLKDVHFWIVIVFETCGSFLNNWVVKQVISDCLLGLPEIKSSPLKIGA